MELTKSKGEDYTKGNPDVLSNFKEGDFVGLLPQQTLAVFMKKHIDAIYNHIKTGGQSESEPISERIVDAINYLIFLQALLVDQGEEIPFTLEKFLETEMVVNGEVKEQVSKTIEKPKVEEVKEEVIETETTVTRIETPEEIVEESSFEDIEDEGEDLEIEVDLEEKKLQLIEELKFLGNSSIEVKVDNSDFVFNFRWLDNYNILISDPTPKGEIFQLEVNELGEDVTIIAYRIDKTKTPLDKMDFLEEDEITSDLVLYKMIEFAKKHSVEMV
jgi:hypothetical protein